MPPTDQERLMKLSQIVISSEALAQTTLQKISQRPDYTQLIGQIITLFNRDAVRFEQELPAKRAFAVRKMYADIKKVAPLVFTNIKPMRTALGWLTDDAFAYLNDFVKTGINQFRQSKGDTSWQQAKFYLYIASVLYFEFSKLLEHELISPNMLLDSDLSLEISHDPIKGRWIRYCSYGYLLLRHYYCSDLNWELWTRKQQDEIKQYYEPWYLSYSLLTGSDVHDLKACLELDLSTKAQA